MTKMAEDYDVPDAHWVAITRMESPFVEEIDVRDPGRFRWRAPGLPWQEGRAPTDAPPAP
jgi:hypothetical protein